MYKCTSACGCSIGRVRSKNEDNLFFNGTILPMDNRGLPDVLNFSAQLTDPIYFGIFDGMGGEAHGKLAAYIAASELQSKSVLPSCIDLVEILQRANTKICCEAHRRGCGTIGTTAAILSVDSTSVCAINVGDSKVYRYRNGAMEQLSTDHTDEALLEQCGIKDRKPRLTQHLGIEPTEMVIEPSIWQGNVLAGDLFLICSDGLSDMLSEHDIADILSTTSPVDCVNKFIDMALHNGGRDNISVIVVSVSEA